jgi:hypothetical protein
MSGRAPALGRPCSARERVSQKHFRVAMFTQHHMDQLNLEMCGRNPELLNS